MKSLVAILLRREIVQFVAVIVASPFIVALGVLSHKIIVGGPILPQWNGFASYWYIIEYPMVILFYNPLGTIGFLILSYSLFILSGILVRKYTESKLLEWLVRIGVAAIQWWGMLIIMAAGSS